MAAAAVASMSEHLRNLTAEVLSDNFRTLRKYSAEQQRRDGSWQPLVREVYGGDNGVAVLPYDPDRRSVVLIRQFRLPAFVNGAADGMLIEVPAGLLDGADPLTRGRAEALEETGLALGEMKIVGQAYTSPGSMTERVTLVIAKISAGSRVAEGGGVVEEAEDIEVLEMGFDAALGMIATGEICDAKTIMLLQHLRLAGIM